MKRLTVTVDEPVLAALKQHAGEEGLSLSAYVARVLRRRMQSDTYHAAAAAERDFPPTEEEIQRDAAHLHAKHHWRPGHEEEEVSGAA
jgi:hypothetical protein